MSELYRLWDFYPLSEQAWPNILFDLSEWRAWLEDGTHTLMIRRWVTGPNGPSFLTEYTPADDYIADGRSGLHATFNGLLQDEDRKFYLPQPQDQSALQGKFAPPNDPLNVSWPQVEAELIASDHRLDELRRMTAPSLIRLIAQQAKDEVSDTDQSVGAAQTVQAKAPAVQAAPLAAVIEAAAAPPAEDQPADTGEAVTNIEGMTWQQARERGESHCRHNLFPGVNALAKIVGCSPATMSKVIKHSPMLRARRAEQETQRKSVSAGPMTDDLAGLLKQSRERDPAEAASVDEVFNRLLQQANPAERARLNNMTLEKRRELVDVVEYDPES